jgi:hypothetical protein
MSLTSTGEPVNDGQNTCLKFKREEIFKSLWQWHIKIIFMMKLRVDKIREMLASIKFRLFYLPVPNLRTKN